MLKWLFGLLVLSNLGLLMWGTWYREPLAPIEAPQPQAPVAVEKMKLLSEPGVRLIARAKAPTPAPPPGENSAAAASCHRLGPFTSPEKARAAATKLENWGLKSERLSEFETQGVGYRVYLPPFASREVAEGKRRELTRLGFADHALIVGEDGMENGISLGLFAVEQNAQARVQQLAQKGVEASVQSVPTVRPVYWLALSTPAVDGKIGDVPIARFTEEDWGISAAPLRPVACPPESATRPGA